MSTPGESFNVTHTNPSRDEVSLRWIGGATGPAYHLVIVTRDLADALAADTDKGWLLPTMGRVAWMGPPVRAQTLVGRMFAPAQVVHGAVLEPHREDYTTQAYVAAVISGPAITRRPSALLSAKPVPVARLLSTPALVPLQVRALRIALERMRSPAAPFDSVDGVTRTLGWAHREIERRTGTPVVFSEPHRCTRFDYIADFRTAQDSICLKAGAAHMPEATMVALLAEHSPEDFPRVLAIDSTQAYWLFQKREGVTLSRQHLSLDDAAFAARSVARVQKRALNATAVPEYLLSRSLNGSDLWAQVNRLVGETWSSAHQEDADTNLLAAWRSCASKMAAACAEMDNCGLPQTLVPTEFGKRSMAVTFHGVIFNDVECSYWSQPLLSLWHLLHHVESRDSRTDEMRIRMTQAFMDEWSDVSSPQSVARGISQLPIAGRLFAMLRKFQDLDLDQRDLQTSLPDWYRRKRLTASVRAVLAECRKVE